MLHKSFLVLTALISIISFASLFTDHDIWWDSAVYVGTGKHIYSLGESGLWEASRPLVWPLIMGFLWKLGLDPIFYGKILVIIFSIGTMIMTYFLATEIFNKKIAVLASLLLFLSPTFFKFINILHTEIISTFLLLVAIYAYVKKCYYISGLFFGLVFMTRFFHIVAIIGILIFSLFLIFKGRLDSKKFFMFLVFFMIPVVPYLILNLFLYNNPLFPFELQVFMTKYTGEIFKQPISFYFINLLKENFFILFVFPAFYYIIKKPKKKASLLALLFLFTFIPYNLIMHKEMRLLIPILPLLYVITSYGIVKSVDVFKNKKIILYLLIIIIIILQIPKLKFDSYEDNLDFFYRYAGNGDGLWISNPSFIAFSDKKAEELIYYPIYDSKRIDFLINNIDSAKVVLLNTCDLLPCPSYDKLCNQKHNEFINKLQNEFDIFSISKGDCKYYIFD